MAAVIEHREPPQPSTRLLHLDARAVAGLRWLRSRCEFWYLALRRRRKYGVPKGANFGEDEADLLRALIDLEQAAKKLLESQQLSA